MSAAPALDATFAALADPTRRAIIARLARGEATVLELAQPFAMSLPAVSKHLKVLERAGLIARGRDAQRRPCRLVGAPLREVADWTDQYRRFWEESFDKLDEYLRELQRDTAPASSKAAGAKPARANALGAKPARANALGAKPARAATKTRTTHARGARTSRARTTPKKPR